MTEILMNNYQNYSLNDESRKFIDLIHISYSCCGAVSSNDFLDLSEVEGYQTLPPQTQLFQCFTWEYCSVPLSCCKSIDCSQRSALFLNQHGEKKEEEEVEIFEKWFNDRGCANAIDGSIFFVNNYWIISFLSLLILIFHLIFIIINQLVLTSFVSLKQANLSSDDPSFSWLINFGYPEAKILIEALKEESSPPEMLKNEKSEFSNFESSKLEKPEVQSKETEKSKISENIQTVKQVEKSMEEQSVPAAETENQKSIKTEKEEKKEMKILKKIGENVEKLVDSTEIEKSENDNQTKSLGTDKEKKKKKQKSQEKTRNKKKNKKKLGKEKARQKVKKSKKPTGKSGKKTKKTSKTKSAEKTKTKKSKNVKKKK